MTQFNVTDIIATIVRLAFFFHLTTVNAFLFAAERQQILLLVTGRQEASSQKINLMLNTALIVTAFLLAVFYPKVGHIAGMAGAIGTFMSIYTLPMVCYLRMLYTGTLPPPPGSTDG